MPLRVEIELQSRRLKMPDIGPLDPPGSFSHSDPLDPYILVVSCNPDDSGGLIYRGNPDTSIVILNNTVRLMSEEAEIEGVVEKNSTFEHELMTRYGLGKIILTHYL